MKIFKGCSAIRTSGHPRFEVHSGGGVVVDIYSIPPQTGNSSTARGTSWGWCS